MRVFISDDGRRPPSPNAIKHGTACGPAGARPVARPMAFSTPNELIIDCHTSSSVVRSSTSHRHQFICPHGTASKSRMEENKNGTRGCRVGSVVVWNCLPAALRVASLTGATFSHRLTHLMPGPARLNTFVLRYKICSSILSTSHRSNS